MPIGRELLPMVCNDSGGTGGTGGTLTKRSGPALTTGGRLTMSASTVMVTSSLVAYCWSFAVRRSTYVPRVSKLTLVVRVAGVSKRTFPGPLTFDQRTAGPAGGMPSSVTVPVSVVFAAVIV